MAGRYHLIRASQALRSAARSELPTTRLAIPRISISKNQSSAFSTTSSLGARAGGKGRPKKDPRIRLIRYFLGRRTPPRPLRFSRLRALRHWTIHRAWMLHRRQQSRAQELELERQYNSMREACEALRLLGEDGMVGAEGGGKEIGRLYRNAMGKQGVWQGVPIEYARAQTEFPPRDGWNHNWKRG